MTKNPLIGWTVDRAAIKTVGSGLQRPECIIAERDGTLWSADARGGVMCIRPDGTQRLVAAQRHRPESGRRFCDRQFRHRCH